MDEPTAALTPREVDVLFDTIASLRRQGVGIIYISHRLEEVRRIAQRVMVLRDGNVAGVVNAAEVSRARHRAHDGRARASHASPAAEPSAPNVGRRPAGAGGLRALAAARSGRQFLRPPRRNVGLFGLLGAGHLDVTRADLRRRVGRRGRDQVRGVRGADPLARAGEAPGRRPRSGRPQSRSPDPRDERRGQPDARALAARRARRVRLARPAVARAQEWVRRLGVRLKSGVRQPIATLSGGNQQKVILARWLEAGVRVLLLNEPTRGVDVGATRRHLRPARRAAPRGPGRRRLLLRPGGSARSQRSHPRLRQGQAGRGVRSRSTPTRSRCSPRRADGTERRRNSMTSRPQRTASPTASTGAKSSACCSSTCCSSSP